MERDRLQLGYAEADITPMTPKKLVGFYREDSLSKGVAAPLTVQAAVYEVCWSMLIYYRYLNRVWPFRRDEASRLVRFVTECRRRGCDSDGR